MKVKHKRAISRAMLAEQQAAAAAERKKMLFSYDGNWKAVETTEGVSLEKLSKQAQLVWYKDRVAELEAQSKMSSTEYRLNKEEIHRLTQRCERYERLLDHLTGHH